MSIITEKKKLWGTLKTPLGEYQMLEEFPRVNGLPFQLREAGMASFSVLCADGYATTIYASITSVVIERPYKNNVEKFVKYIVEDSLKLSSPYKEGDTES